MSDKAKALDIFEEALSSVKPENFLHKQCLLEGDILRIEGTQYDLKDYNNLYIFGSGKAAYTMAKEFESILRDKIYKGLVVAPYDDGELKKIEVKIGSHPIPTQKSIDSALALVELMQKCEEDDLYIYLLSGGSSALLEIPTEPITLDELQSATSLMLSNNLAIDKINTIRKHLSVIKGGRLASLCKASGVVLVLSDVIDNSLENIGSGVLYADKSSFEDAKKILNEKNLYFHMPESVQKVIAKGVDGKIEETPFEPLARVTHHILSSNLHVLQAAKQRAISLGMSVKVVDTPMEGEVGLMAEKIFKICKESNEKCIIFGGECSVNLLRNGKGGRNQHLTLLILEQMCRFGYDITFLSAGTDGVDGNSDAAGAVVDQKSCEKTNRLQLDLERYKNSFDSYNFFRQTDDLIISGPSGTNVADIVILIKGERNG